MASQSKNSICIVIPMLNEEKNAKMCADKIIEEIKKIKVPIRLVIVDDGSTDNTFQILKDRQKKYKKYLTILQHKKNKGYGAALQTGVGYALKSRFDFYLTMDSDLTNPPRYIKHFVKALGKNVDCVKASRYIKNGKVVNVSYFRQFISIVGNTVASIFFGVGVKDCTNGFKMVRLSLLKGVVFHEKNFSIILEELYYLKKKRASFAEVPSILYARKQTKSHFAYTPRIFFDYLKYVLKAAVV